jgi:hypothetical protein
LLAIYLYTGIARVHHQESVKKSVEMHPTRRLVCFVPTARYWRIALLPHWLPSGQDKKSRSNTKPPPGAMHPGGGDVSKT